MNTNDNTKSVMLTSRQRKNQNVTYKKIYPPKYNLQDRKYLQLLKWLDNPEVYREWCEVGHEITMICQILDLALQDFDRLGGELFADTQLHKNALKACDRMVDYELAQWTKQGDERGEQWVSMIGAAQALRERFAIIMNYSFGDKAEWRLNEFSKVIDRSYPQSLRDDETIRRKGELLGILANGGTSEEDANKAIEILKKQGLI